MARVTLLTDFGTRDGYVGAMKGVLAATFPGVIVDDVSHDLAQGDTATAARTVGRYWSRYPGGTVHLVVVDPGVGTERRAIAVEADRRFLVAPDNGVLSHVFRDARSWRAVTLEAAEYQANEVSSTFHGRDVFAPVAAHLARGVHLSRLGPPIPDPVILAEPTFHEDGEGVVGEVVSLDRFGNLITNLPAATLMEGVEVEIAGRRVPAGATYGVVKPREAVALVNSDGRVEVAARDSSAAEVLGARVGTPVRVFRPLTGEGEPASV